MVHDCMHAPLRDSYDSYVRFGSGVNGSRPIKTSNPSLTPNALLNDLSLPGCNIGECMVRQILKGRFPLVGIYQIVSSPPNGILFGPARPLRCDGQVSFHQLHACGIRSRHDRRSERSQVTTVHTACPSVRDSDFTISR